MLGMVLVWFLLEMQPVIHCAGTQNSCCLWARRCRPLHEGVTSLPLHPKHSFFLRSELPKNLLSLPYQNYQPSVKVWTNSPMRFFSMHFKICLFNKKDVTSQKSSSEMGCHQFTSVETEAKSRWTWTCPSYHHTNNSIGGEGLRGLCLPCCFQVLNQKTCYCALKLISGLHRVIGSRNGQWQPRKITDNLS